MENKFESFYGSFSDEILGKVKRLDVLIGRKHWASVGSYKESIIRSQLSESLQGRYKVSTGFVLSSDTNNCPLITKQQDIIIWDNIEYAPIFVDGDFVIVPPEACVASIEVKSTLSKKTLKESLANIDSFACFSHMEDYSQWWTWPRKYIFAYDIEEGFNYPIDVFKGIDEYYGKNKDISIENRVSFSKLHRKYHRYKLPFVDAIFILSRGVVLSRWRFPNDYPRTIYSSYDTVTESLNHTFAYLEYDLQSHLGTLKSGGQGFFYSTQPGLRSVKKGIHIRKTTPISSMIFPLLSKNEIWDDIDSSSLYLPKTQAHLEQS